MNTKLALGAFLAVMTACAVAGESLTIAPLEQATGKPAAGVKKIEKVAVTGTLKTVPMQGAVLTLQSTNYGQVILFSPMDVDAQVEQKLRAMESAGVSVTVSGTLTTVCSPKQLKAETMGCRRFDLTKSIVVERP